jgi:hypothetical protein
VNATLTTADLTDIYTRNQFRDAITFDDFEAVASYATGTRDEAIDTLFAWLRPIGRRPLEQSAIENALRSRTGPTDFAPGSRVLCGDAMAANATADGADGRLERHVGDVAISENTRDVPCWWSHRGDTVLGRLVDYERNQRGPGSLRVWVELAGGPDADEVLRQADYGRIGLSVSVYHDPKNDDGGGVVTLDRQSLREVSLVPINRAAFGESTRVRRVAMPDRAAAAERSAHGTSRLQYRTFEGAHLTMVDGALIAN